MSSNGSKPKPNPVFMVAIELIVTKQQYVRWGRSDRIHLREEIERDGLKEPLRVRPLKHGKWELCDGNHRLYIAKALGWKEVPCKLWRQDEYDWRNRKWRT